MNYGLDAKTIIRLLLDFAPETVLKEMGLTESTHDECVDHLESIQGTRGGYRTIVDWSSEALYYAATKHNAIISKRNREKLHAYGKVEVDIYTLYRFAEMVKAEDFDKVEEIVKEISKVPGRKRMAKAQEWLVRERHDWDNAAEMRAKLLNSGKTPKDADSIIRATLKIPQSTYDGWRKRELLKRKTTV